MFLFKKRKTKFKYVMVYKEIINCSKFYLIHNFQTNERKIVMKEVHNDEKKINTRGNRKKR